MKKLRKQPFQNGDSVQLDGYENPEQYTVVDCKAGPFGSGWGVKCDPNPFDWGTNGKDTYADAVWFSKTRTT